MRYSGIKKNITCLVFSILFIWLCFGLSDVYAAGGDYPGSQDEHVTRTIDYYVNGEKIDSVTVENGDPVTIGTENWPSEYDNYRLITWSTEPDGGGDCFENGDVINMVEQDYALFAQTARVYKISMSESVENVANGRIYCDKDAFPDSDVHVCGVPDEGYMLDHIMVRTESGEEVAAYPFITADSGDSDEWTFMMPHENVIIYYAYFKRPVEPKFTVPTKEKGEDGTPYGKGASKEAAEAAITARSSEKDPKGTVFAPLMLKSAKQSNTSISLTWKTVPGAKKYIIYGNKCGKKNKFKRLGISTENTKTIRKADGKKLKKGTYYKFIVTAIDSSGHVVSTSKIIFVTTRGKGNPTKVTVSKKVTKNKLTIKKGKTFNLAGKAVGRKVKKHAAIRYESSDPTIAKVSKTGKVKGLKKGKCRIFVFADNGICKTIKITIK